MKSHTSMERGLRKVRKARTVVMFLLIAVALAIVLIDRNQDGPLGIQEEVASTEVTSTIVDTNTGAVTTAPPSDSTHNPLSNNTVLNSNDNFIGGITSESNESPNRLSQEPEMNSMQSIPEKNAHELAILGGHKKSEPKVDSNGIRKHTIASGETLGSIAQKYYGKASHWRKIEKANPQINPNRLRLGDEITIPAAKVKSQHIAKLDNKITRRVEKTPSVKNSSKSNSKSKSNYGVKPNSYHEVQRGETLTDIAKRSGVSFLVIYDHNKKVLKNPNVLKPGTRIWIPPLASKR